MPGALEQQLASKRIRLEQVAVLEAYLEYVLEIKVYNGKEDMRDVLNSFCPQPTFRRAFCGAFAFFRAPSKTMFCHIAVFFYMVHVRVPSGEHVKMLGILCLGKT